MPRHPRLFIYGAIYHVYCRVARGEFVFDDDLEAVEFIETLRRVRDLDSWTIFAWCLMGNHYHLVLKTRDVDLWRSMARLQGSVSRSYNRRHRFLGRLWQSRYRARVIDSEDYYRQVIAYVHLNPVAAGVVTDPAASVPGSKILRFFHSWFRGDSTGLPRPFGTHSTLGTSAKLANLRILEPGTDASARTLSMSSIRPRAASARNSLLLAEPPAVLVGPAASCSRATASSSEWRPRRWSESRAYSVTTNLNVPGVRGSKAIHG